jgi:hypothetical protein
MKAEVRQPGPVIARSFCGGVMKKLNRFATLSVFLGMGIAAFGQTPNQRTPPSQQQAEPNEQAGGQPMTIIGCLMKGDTPAQYAITDNKSGEKISFAAPDQLQKFLNQTVQLTGSVMNRGGQRSFQPQSVKAVSPSCETK